MVPMPAMRVLSLVSSLVLLIAAAATALSTTQGTSTQDFCSTFSERDACLLNYQCSWCGLADLAPSCVDKQTVASFPSGAVKCDDSNLGLTSFFGGRKGAAGAAHTIKLTVDSTCSADERESCLALQGCSWCNSKMSWIASECFAEIAARHMDSSMFECETKQTAPSVKAFNKVFADDGDLVYGDKPTPGSYPPPPSPPPPPPPACDDIVSKSECNDRKTCNWCVLKFTGEGTCFTTTEAKYLPPFVFTCSKKHRPQDIFA